MPPQTPSLQLAHTASPRHGDLLFLLRRTSHGFSLRDLPLAESLGYEGYLERQLDHLSIDDSELDGRLAQYETTLNLSSKQLYDSYLLTGQVATVVRELRGAAILRAVFSKRQLFERMVGFWSDHFSIDHTDHECRVLKTADDRDVIRAHALGTFPELLGAAARSGALLFFLDNHTNSKLAPNENFARELLELYTLGAGGPYDEQDVREVARCFTGWTRLDPTKAGYGDFKFWAPDHDDGPKQVLGVSIRAGGGEQDGQKVLDILAHHPATARFIARKLTSWLLVDDPPHRLVQEVAGTYTATGGDIKAMIRTILSRQSVQLVNAAARPKYVRPFRLLVSLLRALDQDLKHPDGLIYELQALGHVPFGWATADGFPDSREAWGPNLLSRWNFASRLLDAKISGVPLTQSHVIGVLLSTGATYVEDAIDLMLTGGRLAAQDKARIRDFVASFPRLTWQVVREAIALGAASPSYQVY